MLLRRVVDRVIRNTFYSIIDGAWPSLVIFLTILILVRFAYLTNTNTKLVIHRELFMLLFVAYILMLFELVTYSDVSFAGTNFVPFREILRYPIGSSSFYNQVIGNIILFVPFGYFVSSLVKLKKVPGIFFMSLIVSSTIECVQYFIGRSFDIDDIILNIVGGIIGFLIYIGISAIQQHLPKIFRRDWFLNILMILIIIVVVLYFTNIFSFGWL